MKITRELYKEMMLNLKVFLRESMPKLCFRFEKRRMNGERAKYYLIVCREDNDAAVAMSLRLSLYLEREFVAKATSVSELEEELFAAFIQRVQIAVDERRKKLPCSVEAAYFVKTYPCSPKNIAAKGYERCYDPDYSASFVYTIDPRLNTVLNGILNGGLRGCC